MGQLGGIYAGAPTYGVRNTMPSYRSYEDDGHGCAEEVIRYSTKQNIMEDLQNKAAYCGKQSSGFCSFFCSSYKNMHQDKMNGIQYIFTKIRDGRIHDKASAEAEIAEAKKRYPLMNQKFINGGISDVGKICNAIITFYSAEPNQTTTPKIGRSNQGKRV